MTTETMCRIPDAEVWVFTNHLDAYLDTLVPDADPVIGEPTVWFPAHVVCACEGSTCG